MTDTQDTHKSGLPTRPVTVGVTDGDDVAIDTGLSVGEQVVVDGAERLRDGSHVELQGRSGS